MEGSSLDRTGKYDSGAAEIEIINSILDQICTHSIFSYDDLKVLLWDWINSGHWWVPTDAELISFLSGDL